MSPPFWTDLSVLPAHLHLSFWPWQDLSHTLQSQQSATGDRQVGHTGLTVIVCLTVCLCSFNRCGSVGSGLLTEAGVGAKGRGHSKIYNWWALLEHRKPPHVKLDHRQADEMDSKAVRGGLSVVSRAMILKARTKVCRGILEKECNKREGDGCFTIVTPSERERGTHDIGWENGGRATCVCVCVKEINCSRRVCVCVCVRDKETKEGERICSQLKEPPISHIHCYIGWGLMYISLCPSLITIQA